LRKKGNAGRGSLKEKGGRGPSRKSIAEKSKEQGKIYNTNEGTNTNGVGLMGGNGHRKSRGYEKKHLKRRLQSGRRRGGLLALSSSGRGERLPLPKRGSMANFLCLELTGRGKESDRTKAR